MSEAERFDRIDKDIATVNVRLAGVDSRLEGIEGRLGGIEGRVTALESGQAALATSVTDMDRRLTKVEITQEAMRDDIKLLAEGLLATNAAIERSADRVIAYIDERISPIEQAVS